MKQLILILTITFSLPIKSQNQLSLKDAIDMALKNNLSLKSEQQKTQYQQALIKTSLSIAPTSFIGQYGQINSLYNDNLFGVSQGFSFPTVYAKHKKMLTEEWRLAQLNTVLKEAEIKKTVSETYYSLLILKEKEKLLLTSDTVYQAFITKAELRLNKGESNLLEKTTAENQRADIQLQLKQLKQEKKTSELFLQFLLNINSDLNIANQDYKVSDETVALDTLILKDHAIIKAMQQQQVVSETSTKYENSKLLPDIFVSYNNMSMKGNGADNVFYLGNKRFQSVQLGFGIPLFMQAQKAKIQAAKIQQEFTANSFESEKQYLQNQYLSAYLQYEQLLQTINYYEKQGLKNATTIQNIANSQFTNGDINYLDWVVLTNQSITVKAKYLDAVKAFNDNIFLLNYLTSK